MKIYCSLFFFFLISSSLLSQDIVSTKPQVKVVVNDSIVDFKSGIKASSLRTIKLNVNPATCIVTEFQISLLRGSKTVGSRVFYSNSMDLLHTLMTQPGDRLLVEAKHIMMTNPDKTVSDVRFEKHSEVIPIK